MEIIVDAPQQIAQLAAQLYITLLQKNANAVLGLATGSTPIALYDQLVKEYKAGTISFQKVTTFNLDEYVGLDARHPQSYRHFMDEHLFNHVDVNPEAVHIPSGTDTSDAALAAYDEAIKSAGGIDIQLLGIGCNGHIGFNEPQTPFESRTHVVELTESTRRANARFFTNLAEVPTHAATMGIKTVMHAKMLVMIATGEEKAEALAAALEGPINANCPASVLQLHPHVVVFCDAAAASKLHCVQAGKSGRIFI